jgi:hypothetical protein
MRGPLMTTNTGAMRASVTAIEIAEYLVRNLLRPVKRRQVEMANGTPRTKAPATNHPVRRC